MRKKSILEYLLIGLFLAFMFGALFAAFGDAVATAELKYFQFGKVLLISFLGLMCVFVCIKITHRISLKMKKMAKLAIWLGACITVVLCGALLRIYVIQVFAVDLSNEGTIYYEIAKHIVDDTLLSAQGEYYRQYAVRSPQLLGYPLFFLAPVFKLFGANVQIALYANVICSVVTMLVALHIGYTLGGKVGGFISVIFVSMWPSYVLSANILSAEPLFTLLLAIVLDIFLLVLNRKPKSTYIIRPVVILPLLLLGGVILALAMSIRSVAVILLIAYAVVQLTMGKFGRENVTTNTYQGLVDKGWLCVLSVTVAFLLTNFGINGLKQETLLEEIPGIIHSHGYQMMMGVNVEENGQWNQQDDELYQNVYAETMSVVDAQEASIQEAMGRIRREPHQILNLMANKFFVMWQSDNYAIKNKLWAEEIPTNSKEALSTLDMVYPYAHVIYVIVLMMVMLLTLNLWRNPGVIEPSQYMMMLFLMGSTLMCMILDVREYYHFNSMLIMLVMAATAVIQWRGHVAEEIPVKIVVKEGKYATTSVDHTHFDMHTALREGHVHMSVSEAVAEKSVQHSLVSVAVADEIEEVLSTEELQDEEQAEKPVEEAVEEALAEAETVAEEVAEESVTEEESCEVEAVVEEAAEEVSEEAIEDVETEAAAEETETAEEAVVTEETAETEPVTEETAEEEPGETEAAVEEATECVAEKVIETVVTATIVEKIAEEAVAAEEPVEAEPVTEETAEEEPGETEAAVEEANEGIAEKVIETVVAATIVEEIAEEAVAAEEPTEAETVAEEATEAAEEAINTVVVEEVPDVPAVGIKAKAPVVGLEAPVDVIPAPIVKPVQKKAAPVTAKPSTAVTAKPTKPAAKKTAHTTELKTPRAPAKKQKLNQQERVQRTVDRRKAVARRKQRRQRQAARRG